MFGCKHRDTTFPITPSRKSSPRRKSGMYVTCLSCGKEFDYSWAEMRVVVPSWRDRIQGFLGITNKQKRTAE